MRKIKIIVSIAVVFILITALPGWAQGNLRSRMGPFSGLNLTEDQINKIQEMRLEFQKEILELRFKIQSRYLELRSLNFKGEPQEKIDDMTAQVEKLNEELEQKYANHRSQIREILTDEQKVIFDRWGGLGLGLDRMDGMGFGRSFGRMFGRERGRGRPRGPGMRMGRGFRYPWLYRRGIHWFNRF